MNDVEEEQKKIHVQTQGKMEKNKQIWIQHRKLVWTNNIIGGRARCLDQCKKQTGKKHIMEIHTGKT